MDKVNWREASREGALGAKLAEFILGNSKTDDLSEWVGLVIVGLWVIVMFC